MYTITLINPLNQFGKIFYDALIVDDEGVLPNVRIPISVQDNISGEDLEILKDSLIQQQTLLQLTEAPKIANKFTSEMNTFIVNTLLEFERLDVDGWLATIPNPQERIDEAVQYVVDLATSGVSDVFAYLSEKE